MVNNRTIKNFYDLPVWQESRKLVLDIYKITIKFPKEETYGLISQIRRASMSVAANIAEGFGRFHYKDKIKFYLQARGSLIEVQNYIFLSQDLKYIDKEAARVIFKKCNDIQFQLNSIIKKNRNINS
jgi:four helix bundle protein